MGPGRKKKGKLTSLAAMADPRERRIIGEKIAGIVLSGEPKENRDAFGKAIANSLIVDQSLRRFLDLLEEHLPTVRAPDNSEPLSPASSSDPVVIVQLSKVEKAEEMRETALKKIESVVGVAPVKLGQGHTYRAGSGPDIYVRTSSANLLNGGVKKYWFGLIDRCWKDPNAWFVLQCELEFALVVRVEEWLGFKEKFSRTKTNGRQPHLFQDGNTYTLKEEKKNFYESAVRWVDNWEQFAAAHLQDQ